MGRLFHFVLSGALLSAMAVAQVDRLPQSPKPPSQNQAPPRSEPSRSSGESSSKDTQIDLNPPPDDAKSHPLSGSAIDDAQGNEDGDVQEMHSWDPHRAAKSIEVGDFYFKKKNYRAALDRYKEALEYKPNDALTNLHIAQCLVKLNDPEGAADHYQEYLKILPQGEFAAEARKAVETLRRPAEKSSAAGQTAPK
jgi:tetratricopeptide (TPR) repeat protein